MDHEAAAGIPPILSLLLVQCTLRRAKTAFTSVFLLKRQEHTFFLRERDFLWHRILNRICHVELSMTHWPSKVYQAASGGGIREKPRGQKESCLSEVLSPASAWESGGRTCVLGSGPQ